MRSTRTMRPVRVTSVGVALGIGIGIVAGPGESLGQERTRSAIAESATREAVVRGLSVVPDLDQTGRVELSRIVVTGTMGTELIKVLASSEPIEPFEARQLAVAGPYQMVRAQAQGVTRSLSVTMLGDEPAPAGQRPFGSPSVRPVSSAEWVVCHQTISTVPALSASLQRTRSLAVTRTSESGGSATCEESAR